MNYVIRNRATGQLHRVLSGAVVATYPTLQEATNAATNLSLLELPDTGGIWEDGTLYEAGPDPRAKLGGQLYADAVSGDTDSFADNLVKLLRL